MNEFPYEAVFFFFLLICLLGGVISTFDTKSREDVRRDAELYAWNRWAQEHQSDDRYAVFSPEAAERLMMADYEVESGINVPQLLR